MAEPLSPAAYVVLGMLRLGARSGYDVKRVVEISTRYFWNISPAQIYPALERLEDDGLAVGRSEPQGARARRVYEITPAGEEALAAWVGRVHDIPFELRDMGWLKLFFADAAGPEGALAVIRSIRERNEAHLRQMREEVRPAADALADEAGHRFPRVVLDFGMAAHEAVIAACERYEDELAATTAAQGRDAR